MYAQYNRMISFVSVHHAMRAERLLTQAEIETAAIPTPREIDISCGQCLLFRAGDQEKLVNILQQTRIQWSKLFACDRCLKRYDKLAEYSEGT